MTERQHAVDPSTLADGTVVEISNGEGEKSFLVFINGEGFEWQRKNVGLRYPSEWGNYRIVRVLDTTEVWEPLPVGPTEKHVGRKVKSVYRDAEWVAVLGEVADTGKVLSVAKVDLGYVELGEWYVLVEPRPADPDAALRRKVADILWRDAPSTRDEAERAAYAVIAAVREAGEQA